MIHSSNIIEQLNQHTHSLLIFGSHHGCTIPTLHATAVSPEGRITPGCTGIWNDQLADAFAPIVRGIKANGAVPGIQIAHAGRKASANRPWEGDDHIASDDPRSWQTIAPSALPFGANLPKMPEAMTLDDIARVKSDFVAAAKRALAVGFEWLELHFAHGYLAQSFFSEHANQRTDAYGGSFENRCRFLLEPLAAVREVWPENLPAYRYPPPGALVNRTSPRRPCRMASWTWSWLARRIWPTRTGPIRRPVN